MSINKFCNLAKKTLFPICRSITGNGIKETLKIIRKEFPKLKICKIKCGTKVFDWKIPDEWNIKDAYVIDNRKEKIIDFKKNNLHLINYSTPISKKINRDDLLKKISTLPKKPNAIPYLTSYYEKKWGFCTTHNQKKYLFKKYKKKDQFNVVIKSKFNNKGHLNYGELLLPGQSKQEILISTYICHPSMANNELSGPIVSMALIKYFMKKKLNKTMRFIFIPETIGSLAYLSKKLKILKKNVIGGFNLTCIGDDRNHSCMLSRNENSQSDKAIIQCYKKLKIKHKIFSYLERGSDERQFNSPYIDLGITSIFRTKYGEYPEYHTSLDSFGHVVTKRGLNGGFKVAKKSIEILQKKIIPKSMIVCEPQFGRRGFFKKLSIEKKKKQVRDLINFMTFSDGTNDLEDISKKLRISYNKSKFYLNILLKHNLIFC
tara:strand:+ start:56 stop:1348 length:1293 start_codon:yes stop_codon:yes gene_type:complete